MTPSAFSALSDEEDDPSEHDFGATSENLAGPSSSVAQRTDPERRYTAAVSKGRF